MFLNLVLISLCGLRNEFSATENGQEPYHRLPQEWRYHVFVPMKALEDQKKQPEFRLVPGISYEGLDPEDGEIENGQEPDLQDGQEPRLGAGLIWHNTHRPYLAIKPYCWSGVRSRKGSAASRHAEEEPVRRRLSRKRANKMAYILNGGGGTLRSSHGFSIDF